MSRRPGHRVVTLERQGGFAARCEHPDCNAITFGGFPTRTAARDALAGHEDSEALASVKKNGPGELQLNEAATPTKEIQMQNQTTAPREIQALAMLAGHPWGRS